jgi:hypothetical protein
MSITVPPILNNPELSFYVCVNGGEWEPQVNASLASRLVAHNIFVGHTVQVEFRGASNPMELKPPFDGLIYHWLHELGHGENYTTESNGNFSGYWIGD